MAQLVRASPSHGEDRRFESFRAHYLFHPNIDLIKSPMSSKLDILFERWHKILPADLWPVMEKDRSLNGKVIRVNSLKSDSASAMHQLVAEGVAFEKTILPYAFFVRNQYLNLPLMAESIASGYFYVQSLSSQLAVHVLDPQPNERILDLCASPGGKTSQIAMLMENTGKITAIDTVKDRIFKLKRVLKDLDVQNAETLLMDGRRFRPLEGLYDRVLVDAPCSSEGRIDVSKPKTFAYWSLRKIQEMKRKQKGLLLNALRCCRPGGTLVYSTCTLAPEENEGVIDWLIRKAKAAIRIDDVVMDVPRCDCLTRWNKEFHPDVKKGFRIVPLEKYDAFFITKITRMDADLPFS